MATGIPPADGCETATMVPESKKTGLGLWAVRNGATNTPSSSGRSRKGFPSQGDLFDEFGRLVIFEQQSLAAVLVHPQAIEFYLGSFVRGEKNVFVSGVSFIFEFARVQVTAEM